MNDNPDASIEREREIFLAALEKTSPEDRKVFLDRACGDDTALRARVESLLRNHSEDSFLEEPAMGAETRPSPESIVCESVGTVIGRYKLLQKIGEGGMGVVYMAEQEEPVRRKVALKVIKLGMDTKQVVARFEVERQALALMDHPNIAKVLDGGATDTGRPYFVMELVQGVPITEFCDKNQLSVEERVKLFIPVCQAIQSAHQKGIIHRDLKPNNILVTLNAGVPHPMVIDFGVAKATNQKLTEKTVFTNYATMIGTPAYMSPEQAEMSRLDVDTRTDIYGLGVLLYELLTGTTPFPEKRLRSVGYNEMQRIIMEEEPERPSTRLRRATITPSPSHSAPPSREGRTPRDPDFSTDLDWILMKCLEKDRARRYETANGLAADLKRHLENEPVMARPPSNLYRFQKLVRRNKIAVASGLLVVVALLVGLAISTFLFIQERRAHDSATRAEKLAAGRLIESENARKDSEAVSKFLTEVFQSPDPERDARTITVAETLSNAVGKLAVDLANQPARRAKLQATLGRTYYALGLYREAIPLQLEVRDYYLAASGPENPDTITALYDLARSYGQAGRAAEAVKIGEQVLAFRRKMSGPEHPDTLWAMNNLAIAYYRTDRTAEALTLQEQVLRLRRKVLGPEHPDTLVAMNNLAVSYSTVDREDQALKLLEEVLALWQKVGPERPGTLLAMHNLGYSYQKAGRREEALKLREKVLALYRKVLGPENPYTLWARRALADSYYSAGRLDEALKLREETLALYRKVLGPEHPETLNAMNELAESYGAARRWGEALKLREEGLALRRKVLGPEHSDTLLAMNNLGVSYDEAGRLDEALKLGEQTLALYRKVNGPERPETILAIRNLGVYYDAAGRLGEALKLREELLALDRKVQGPEHPDTILAMRNLATSYAGIGRHQEAITLWEKACEMDPKDTGASLSLATWQTWFGQDAEYEATRRRLVEQAGGTDVVDTAARAAKAYCIRPSTDAALLEKALNLAQRAVELGKSNLFLPYFQEDLGMAEYRNGHYAAAEMPLTIAEQTGGKVDDTIPGIARLFHAMSLFRQGRAEEARVLLSQAEAKMPPLPKDESKTLVDGKLVSPRTLLWWLAYKEAKELIEGPISSGQ